MEIYAHRGSSLDHPENTLPAFAAAIDAGASGIETDLRLTRDGAIVLVHDRDLRRVSGRGRRISASSLAEVRDVPLEQGLRVPTLDELWEVAAHRVRLNLEIKAPPVVGPLATFLRGRTQGILVTSSHFAALDRIGAELPDLETGPVLTRFGRRARARLSGGRYRAVSLSVEAYSDEVLAFCQDSGIALRLWVVNEAPRVVHFARRGVDGVFTDCPRAAVEALSTL